jgi:ABC-type nitrate/sulfonate/bicarbonate transport system substrate-binding protein
MASLANPNVISMAVMIEKGYINAEFVPVTGDISSLVGLIRSNKVDVIAVNYEAAEKISKLTGWIYSGSTISRAVYIITNKSIDNKDVLENRKIVSSFRGGSPDILFQKLNLKNQPTYTDMQIAVQLFLKGDFDTIVLPEPHVSNLLLKLSKLQKNYFVYDIVDLIGKDFRFPINAILCKDKETDKVLKEALIKSVDFVNQNPAEATKIFERYFRNYFELNFPFEAFNNAIESGRLKFEYSK